MNVVFNGIPKGQRHKLHKPIHKPDMHSTHGRTTHTRIQKILNPDTQIQDSVKFLGTNMIHLSKANKNIK